MVKVLVWLYRLLGFAFVFAVSKWIVGEVVFDDGYWMQIIGATAMAFYDLLDVGKWIKERF